MCIKHYLLLDQGVGMQSRIGDIVSVLVKGKLESDDASCYTNVCKVPYLL